MLLSQYIVINLYENLEFCAGKAKEMFDWTNASTEYKYCSHGNHVLRDRKQMKLQLYQRIKVEKIHFRSRELNV